MTRMILGSPQCPIANHLADIRAKWGWILAIGILSIIMGTLMIGAPIATNLGTMMFLSIMLIVSGVGTIVGAFFVRCWSGFTLQLLAGVLNLVLGVLTLQQPIRFSEVLTLLIAAVLFVGGLSRVVGSLITRFDGWWWICLNGLISLAMAVMIWRQWPLSGIYVIGLFIGIDVLMLGWTWVMLALAIKRLPSPDNSLQAT